MLRKTLMALLLLGVATIGKATTNGNNPVELPAIIVSGFVEDDYGFQFASLFWTIPYNTYGAQGMKGLQYAQSGSTFGRMLTIPARLSGPHSNVGNPTRTILVSIAIDTDGDPRERGFDPHWQADTSGGYNSALTPFVCYTSADFDSGVRPGDWAQIINNGNGQSIWAYAGDFSDGHPEGEISEAAAAQMGWQFYQNSDLRFNISNITIHFFAGSKGK